MTNYASNDLQNAFDWWSGGIIDIIDSELCPELTTVILTGKYAEKEYIRNEINARSRDRNLLVVAASDVFSVAQWVLPLYLSKVGY